MVRLCRPCRWKQQVARGHCYIYSNYTKLHNTVSPEGRELYQHGYENLQYRNLTYIKMRKLLLCDESQTNIMFIEYDLLL